VKNYTYNWEIQTLLEQFIGAFNDVIVKRYDINKNQIAPLSGFKVSYVYGPKQRIFNTLKNPAPGGLRIPAIAVSIASVSRDQTRVFNKNDGFNVPYNTTITQSDFLKKIPQPVPVNIAVNMTLITKYQSDMDQLISNFAPYCDPYIVISWKLPNLQGSTVPYEIRTEVLWSGSINLTYPVDASPSQPFRIIGDTSFTIKGWLFKKSDEIYKKIYVINSDYNAVDIVDENAPVLEDIESYDTKWFTISARPQPRKINPYRAYAFDNPLSANQIKINVFGKSFYDIKNIYVSASNISMFENFSFYNPFSAIDSLSGKYPPFNGTIIPSFILFNENYLSFVLPEQPKTNGFIDIILENEAGYGKITVDSRLPFLSSCSGATNIQFPYISGFNVLSTEDPTWVYPNNAIMDEFSNHLLTDFFGYVITTE
jgi:hypothetical protein